MRIAVDLTPILPGGSNGGAKIMTIQLIKEMAALARDKTFILIASKDNFAELSQIQAPNIEVIREFTKLRFNIRNLCMLLVGAPLWPILKISKNLFPDNIKARLVHHYHQFRSNLLAKDLGAKIKPDLLFCPFTAPFYYGLRVPIVSVIYDLQSQHHPHFFTIEERFERKKNFEEACRRARKLVCISRFVKKTVLENSQLTDEQVKAVHIRLAHRLPKLDESKMLIHLKQQHLTNNQFLLYPANYWPHKNHQMLFTAFNLYRKQYPHSKLKLICTGVDNDYKQSLVRAIKAMNLSDWIEMPGYLSDEESYK